jgi:ABC-type transporter Mla subunit MlaD
MKNQFSKLVYDNLNENKALALTLLFEAGEEAAEEADDLFDMGNEEASEDESGDESGDAVEEPEEEAEEDTSEETEPEKVSPNIDIKLGQLKNLQNDIKKVADTLSQGTATDGVEDVEKYIANSIQLENNMIEYSKKSISGFLFEEDESLETISASLEDLDRILDKGSEVIDKFKKGKDVNIESYVDAAINAYRNFDNLFSKEKIVKQAAINMLVLNSGVKAEENIKKFEELFHEELNKQFGVEYDEHALITPEMNVAAGAKSSS